MKRLADAPGTGLLEQDLRDEVAQERVVVIVGAGVSVGATRNAPVASWAGLLENGISRCEQIFLNLPEGWGDALRARLRSPDADQLLSVAEEVAETLGAPAGGEYRRWLRETVGALKPQDPQVIEALLNLGVPIVTTNYDSLIEEVGGLDAVTWRDEARVERLIRRADPGVLHLHGHWEEPESVVLGIRSYEDILGDAYAQFVPRALSAFNSLLFVGSGEGVKDPNFMALRRWLADVSAGLESHHFRLALESEARALAAEHERDERIFVVSYGSRHEDLAPFLRRLRPPVPRRAEPGAATRAGWARRHLRLLGGAAAVAAAGIVAGVILLTGGGGGNSVSRTIAIGQSVFPGTPVAGAGEIRGSDESDVYTFAGAGRRITLIDEAPSGGSCPGFPLYWRLVHVESGDTVFDQSMGGCNWPSETANGYELRSGTYSLTVYATEGWTGDYRFILAPIVEEHFPVKIGATIFPGQPGPGAGEITRPGERDVYTFSDPGAVIRLVNKETPGGGCPNYRLYWKLVHVDSDDVIFDESLAGCYAPSEVEKGYKLRPGKYALTVYGTNGALGAYRIGLRRGQLSYS